MTKVALIVLMACMLIASSHAKATLTCDQVTIWLTPCIPYGMLGGSVSPMCCQGVHSINAAYKNGDDRRLACQCIQDKAAQIPLLDYTRVNQIGELCGSECPYKVYPSTDCSKVK
ncbi:non-specific lipid-transfer protein 1-like [Trifolium pratense]|uniref:non-specific lipid-transfer protein 1-like n=1 Tax=Trifolium pratense TaxID=57577 RepID=UPI001E690613|nr:non-specific lipid-transfer protein 1-like [Trifolium pratense]